MLRTPRKLAGPPRDLANETQMRQYWDGAIGKHQGKWYQCTSTLWWSGLKRASHVTFSPDPSGDEKFPTLSYSIGTLNNVRVREGIMSPIILRAVGGVFRCESSPTLGGVRITGLVRQGNFIEYANYEVVDAMGYATRPLAAGAT